LPLSAPVQHAPVSVAYGPALPKRGFSLWAVAACQNRSPRGLPTEARPRLPMAFAAAAASQLLPRVAPNDVRAQSTAPYAARLWLCRLIVGRLRLSCGTGPGYRAYGAPSRLGFLRFLACLVIRQPVPLRGNAHQRLAFKSVFSVIGDATALIGAFAVLFCGRHCQRIAQNKPGQLKNQIAPVESRPLRTNGR
jgi:hypothetical protein